MTIYEKLYQKKAKIAVIGLGYAGLPVALAFGKQFSVIGFDKNAQRIALLERHIDMSGEIEVAAFEETDIFFTCCEDDIKDAVFFVVVVPTPVDKHKVPDLSFLLEASKTVGKNLKKGDYVIFESTVYPGCTEEQCLPVIEHFSGLLAEKDFKIGYSPERINPGDKIHTLSNTVKIVAGCDEESLTEISAVYAAITNAGVHCTPNIKTAEAAKIVENTQRDVNISLMNELSVIFNQMGINTYDVLEAASTKWNFMRFTPGLVGGHCINIDPYYLTHKARQLGHHSKVIAAGCSVNDEMPGYVSKKVAQYIIKNTGVIKGARVLVLGVTFKENIKDIRNSKVADMVKDLLEYAIDVDLVDLNADATEVENEYELKLSASVGVNYDAVILAVPHDAYKNFTEEYFINITKPNALFVDLKSAYRNKISKLVYWSL